MLVPLVKSDVSSKGADVNLTHPSNMLIAVVIATLERNTFSSALQYLNIESVLTGLVFGIKSEHSTSDLQLINADAKSLGIVASLKTMRFNS